MPNLTYKIKGMDCAEEISILKKEMGPKVGGEDRLSFDLLNGKMRVDTSASEITDEEVIRSVKQTGMEAIPCRDYQNQSQQKQSFWSQHGRFVLCTASGIFLVSGFLSHTLHHGIWDALTLTQSARHEFPFHSLILYCIAMVCGGWYVFPKALYSLKQLQPDMNLLMTVAVFGAIAIGEWFEGATVTFLFAFSLLLESWSVSRARRAIGSLVELSPLTARCKTEANEIEEKPVEEVKIDTIIMVYPGEKIPLDGIIQKGTSQINQAPITGESVPVHKIEGDEVFAGTINEDSTIEFQVTKESSDTTLARIIQLVEEAQSRRAPSEQWVEKFARYYTPAMMFLAIAVALFPPIFVGGDWIAWLYEGLVILVIACPCALVISTPVSIVAGLTAAARQGVLVKGGIFLEQPAKLEAIAFDKTGTLTYGKPIVQEIMPMNGKTEEEVLVTASALESHSDHPLARAIMQKVKEKNLSYESAKEFTLLKGKGAEGLVDGNTVWIGSHRLLHEKNLENSELHNKIEEIEDTGHSVVVLGDDHTIWGLVSIGDEVRDTAKSVIQDLQNLGIKELLMLTGDNQGTAKAISDSIGMTEYKAEMLPEDKVEAVEQLVKQYKTTAMIGDGVNDAPAMARSSMGIAMGAAGTEAAIETADIALMSDDISNIPWLIKHSRRTLAIIKQNIIFALGVKSLFLILAFMGLATLWMAIAADMGASILVIFNALRLLQTDSVNSNILIVDQGE